MRGRGGGFNISPAQEEIGVTIQNTPTRNFFKNHFIGATLSETICFHGNGPGFCACVPTTELLVLRLDILKITNPKPVTKLYRNCKADATKLC